MYQTFQNYLFGIFYFVFFFYFFNLFTPKIKKSLKDNLTVDTNGHKKSLNLNFSEIIKIYSKIL